MNSIQRIKTAGLGAALTILWTFSLTVGGAWAQTPTPTPDPTPTAIPYIPRLPVGGVYRMKPEMPTGERNVDIVQVCCYRVDMVPPIELGCSPAAPGEIVEFDVSIEVTVDNDAEVRCRSIDSAGYTSDPSGNAYTMDFTKPDPPIVR